MWQQKTHRLHKNSFSFPLHLLILFEEKMKKLLWIPVLAVAAFAAPAMARDTTLHLPLSDVLQMPEAKEKLDNSFKFFLAGQATPRVLEKLGEGVSNPKTSGFAKSDETGCKWAALSALISLQKSAKREGANAVIDIVSFYKKQEARNDITYECHAGAIIVGVALKGTYAKIAD
ncbi:excinuclease ATPase subunit [Undibacterium sp. TJN25]|uniref:excinuclease ATPase subunit n=1 Tax=Undibacterium sp. TJN25 TaxID=3413056 RepID=UPI003BF2EE7F